ATPPPAPGATMWNALAAPSGPGGPLLGCCCTLLGKTFSSGGSLTSHCPVPGAMRTRAMASLRRPVPIARPVTTGRAAARRPASADVSVVYSDGAASAPSSGCRSSSSPVACVLVGSATVPSSRLVIGSCQATSVVPAALLGARRRGPGRLCDLGDGEWGRLLCLVRVVRARVHLELAQHVPAQRVLGQHALDRVLDQPLRVLGEKFRVGVGTDASRVAGVPVHPLVGKLVAGQRDLRGVDHDHEVTGVQVRREDRLVL